VELASLLVEFEVDELVAVGHAGDVHQPGQVDADEAAVCLVGLEGRSRQREIDHPDVGGVDRPDLEAVILEVDLALVHQHAHRAECGLERVRAHDGVEHC